MNTYFEKRVTLKPIKFDNHAIEKVLVLDDDYPFAMIHLDMFYDAHEPDDIYEKLISGETVECEIRLTEVI